MPGDLILSRSKQKILTKHYRYKSHFEKYTVGSRTR